MPDVRLPAGVREHLEHVRVGLVGAGSAGHGAGSGTRAAPLGGVGVGHLPGALARPQLLPAALDRVRVIAVLGHADHRRLSPACGPSGPAAGDAGAWSGGAASASRRPPGRARTGGGCGPAAARPPPPAPWTVTRCRTAAAGRTRCPAGSPAPSVLAGQPRRQRERHVDARRDARRGHQLAVEDDALVDRHGAERPQRSSASQCEVARLARPAAPRPRGSASPCTPTSYSASSRGRARSHSSTCPPARACTSPGPPGTTTTSGRSSSRGRARRAPSGSRCRVFTGPGCVGHEPDRSAPGMRLSTSYGPIASSAVNLSYSTTAISICLASFLFSSLGGGTGALPALTSRGRRGSGACSQRATPRLRMNARRIVSARAEAAAPATSATAAGALLEAACARPPRAPAPRSAPASDPSPRGTRARSDAGSCARAAPSTRRGDRPPRPPAPRAGARAAARARAAGRTSVALNCACPPGRRTNITSARAIFSASSRSWSCSTSASARSIPAVTPAEVHTRAVADVDRLRVHVDLRVRRLQLARRRPSASSRGGRPAGPPREQERARAHRHRPARAARARAIHSISSASSTARARPSPPGHQQRVELPGDAGSPLSAGDPQAARAAQRPRRATRRPLTS